MTTANMMWGLMSPISKMVLITSIITPFIIVEIRIIGAAILFWIASIFTKREHVSPPDLLKLSLPPCWEYFSTKDYSP